LLLACTMHVPPVETKDGCMIPRPIEAHPVRKKSTKGKKNREFGSSLP
jgi:hypothetical protein